MDVSKNFVRHYAFHFVCFFLGCLGCFLLQAQLHWSAILASSILGFLITFVPFPSKVDSKGVQYSFYTGTFAGMSSPLILAGYREVLLLSGVGALIYVVVKPYFAGLGGKMGATAFLATCAWLLLRVLC